MSRPPRVAVIVPARGAHATIERCLESLAAQSYRDFETIVVDDSSRSGIADLLVSRFPNVRHLHLPGADGDSLRNRGARASSAPLLVFTEPDAYARPDCIEQLVRAYEETGEAIVGAVDCYGRRWLDRAVHLCNFAKWLPEGTRREVDMAPGSAVLLRRADYVAAGGFAGARFIGDVSFSSALRAKGRGIILEPAAVVEHHWGSSFEAFVRERWQGGTRYGTLRALQRANDRFELLWWLTITALPIRLASFAARLVWRCARAGRLRDLASSSPVVAFGFSTSLAGEAYAYAKLLVAPSDLIRRTTAIECDHPFPLLAYRSRCEYNGRPVRGIDRNDADEKCDEDCVRGSPHPCGRRRARRIRAGVGRFRPEVGTRTERRRH